MTTAVLLVLLGALSRLLPHPPNAVAMGALALYGGARLPRRLAFAVPLAAMAVADFFLDAGTGRAILSLDRLVIYATFAAIVALGRFGRRAFAPVPPVRRLFAWPALAASGSVLFFATSNFAEWVGNPMYSKTGEGLLLCYTAAIPFFWNTLAADLAGTAVLFGLDALTRQLRAAPARRASAILALSLALPAALARHACAQAPSPAAAPTPVPVSESVVVTATLVPEDEKAVGSATTVIPRQRIEESGATTVLEVLRTVPSVDVARQGGDGALTSIFLRGTNSTQTLVLVDGMRVNSPFFAGYDFSAMTTENVERIEIVRGPFSALYGSDAIGGVIQVFTRPAAGGSTGRATLEAGSAGQRQGSAFLSMPAGPIGISASFRSSRVDGDRANEDWREKNGSVRLETRFGNDVRVAVEGSILDGETGNPGAVGNPSTARGLFREERVGVPIQFSPADGHQANVLLAAVTSKPSFRDPAGGFSSDTDARSLQGRVSDSWTSGTHALTAFASWDRWQVDDASNFGTNLDGRTSTLWGGGVQDVIALGHSITATAGVRYDRHSEFGSAWSPRGTLAWLSSDALWKVRISAGRAFRAPTAGELYYPFFGNSDLAPERSSSYEAGVERYFSGGRAEVSFFWNDLKNLIVPDFATFRNSNIGRARTRGVEVAWLVRLLPVLDADLSYTYLDAEDLVKSVPLSRRPRHRAALSLVLRPARGLTVSPRAVFVGSRRDIDGLSFKPVDDPSYTRLDLFARYELAHFAPYARLENATNRRYAEVNGYPAPSRRWAGGVEVKF